jgi:hypothetical protein
MMADVWRAAPYDRNSAIWLRICGLRAAATSVAFLAIAGGDLVNLAAASDEEVRLDLGRVSRSKEAELVDLATAQHVATLHAQTGGLAADMPWKRES